MDEPDSFDRGASHVRRAEKLFAVVARSNSEDKAAQRNACAATESFNLTARIERARSAANVNSDKGHTPSSSSLCDEHFNSDKAHTPSSSILGDEQFDSDKDFGALFSARFVKLPRASVRKAQRFVVDTGCSSPLVTENIRLSDLWAPIVSKSMHMSSLSPIPEETCEDVESDLA